MAKRQDVEATLKKIKQRIVEYSKSKLSETDTRQGLINPLFMSLGWDFSDFSSVKSELRSQKYKEAVDYAFFSEKSGEVPVLVLESKALGTNLSNGKVIKQLCAYLGELGAQWGVLSDGNKYVMYNSNGGKSFDDWKFMTLSIKDMDTDDGYSCEQLADKFIALLSRGCLENDDIQKTYKDHMEDQQIESALMSLLSEPFDTLAQAIRREFKQERVQTNENLRITQKRIVSYLQELADEEGKLPVDSDSASTGESDDVMQVAASVSNSGESPITMMESKKRSKRVTIKNLIDDGILQEGDNLKMVVKGENHWARVTGNGELDADGKVYGNPSKAAAEISNRPMNGWFHWMYKTDEGQWVRIRELRKAYQDKHNLSAVTRQKKAA